MALSTRSEDLAKYFLPPYSADPIPQSYADGIIPLSCMALLSVVSCSGLLGWITYRLLAWRKYYASYVGYNQYVVLIYQLLLADLIQSIGFSLSLNWIRIGKILAPTATCFAQGFLINLGDVSSGLFVLSIALHTYIGVVRGKKLQYNYFLIGVLFCWMFGLLLAIIGPASHGMLYFTQAGAPWCFISPDYEDKRLWLHYLWIFIAEFGSIVIYVLIFLHLRKRVSAISNQNSSSSKQISRAAQYMIVYPIVYIILTLPLATGRMVTMAHNRHGHPWSLKVQFSSTAASLMTSCGWLDTLLYTLTRRVLIKDDPTMGTAPNSDPEDTMPGSWALQSFDAKTARSVTITGGKHTHGSVPPSRNGSIAARRGHKHIKIDEFKKLPDLPTSDDSSSLASINASTDNIIGNIGYGNVVAQTKVKVRIEPAVQDTSARTLSSRRNENGIPQKTWNPS